MSEIATKFLPENEENLSKEENEKLVEKLIYKRYASYRKYPVEEYASLSSENFVSVVKAFMNGYSKEDVKEMVESGKFVKFDNEVVASIDNLVDEYGMQGEEVTEDIDFGELDFDELGI